MNAIGAEATPGPASDIGFGETGLAQKALLHERVQLDLDVVPGKAPRQQLTLELGPGVLAPSEKIERLLSNLASGTGTAQASASSSSAAGAAAGAFASSFSRSSRSISVAVSG